MKNKQKGFLIPAMIAIVLILTIGGGGYVYLESKKVAKVEIGNKETEVVSTSTDVIDTVQIIPEEKIDTEIVSTSTESESIVTKSSVKNDNKILGSIYKIGTSTVEYKGVKIYEADPKSFVPLSNKYGKDNKNIYYKYFKLSTDVENFTVVGEYYGKDRKSVYYGGFVLENADSITFQEVGGGYFKDKSSVYYKNEKIVGADSKTFLYKEGFGKDKNKSYLQTFKINPSDNVVTTKEKNGVKTIIKSATSTTTIFTGDDGSQSSMTISKEEEEYIKKNTTYSCGNETCFNESVKNCTPVTMTANLEILGKLFYEIKPKASNSCTLTFKYLEHLNPEYVGKGMTCEINNKLSFEDVSAEMYSNATLKGNPSNCSGSFYEDIKYEPLPPGVTIGN